MRLDEIRNEWEAGRFTLTSKVLNEAFPALLTIAEAAVKLRDIDNTEPRMVHWDAYTKWQADVADAVTAVENAVDAFEEATG